MNQPSRQHGSYACLIWFNPCCSKCRKVDELIHNRPCYLCEILWYWPFFAKNDWKCITYL